MRPLLAFIAAALFACSEEIPDRCAAAAGASASCQAACDNLHDIECRPAPTVEECVATCEAAGASIPAAERDRALACYAAADTCGEVEGCSRSCGAGGGAIEWDDVDAGSGSPDAGL